MDMGDIKNYIDQLKFENEKLKADLLDMTTENQQLKKALQITDNPLK